MTSASCEGSCPCLAKSRANKKAIRKLSPSDRPASIFDSMGAPFVSNVEVRSTLHHGRGHPPIWPALIGAEGAPDVPAAQAQ